MVEASVIVAIASHDECRDRDGFDLILTNGDGFFVHFGEAMNEVCPLLRMGHELAAGGKEVWRLLVEVFGGEGESIFEVRQRLAIHAK